MEKWEEPELVSGSTLTEGREYYDIVLSSMMRMLRTRIGCRKLRAYEGGNYDGGSKCVGVYDLYQFCDRNRYRYDYITTVIGNKKIDELIPRPDNDSISHGDKVDIAFTAVQTMLFSLLALRGMNQIQDILLRKVADAYDFYPSIFSYFLILVKKINTISFRKITGGQMNIVRKLVSSIEENEQQIEVVQELDLRKLPSELVFLHLFNFVNDIRDLINYTSVSRIFHQNIWEHVLKGRRSKREFDYFLLFRLNIIISDSLLSKLITYEVLDLKHLFIYTFPYLFEKNYQLSLKSISNTEISDSDLVITDYECEHMPVWNLHEVLTKQSVFSKYANRRWNSSRGSYYFRMRRESPGYKPSTTELLPFLRFSKNVNPEISITRSTCKKLFSVFKKGFNLSDYLVGLSLVYEVYQEDDKYFIIYVQVFRDWNETFFIKGLDYISSSLNVRRQCVEQMCWKIVSQQWKNVNVLVPLLISKFGIDPSYLDNKLLKIGCNRGDVKMIEYLLKDFESVRSFPTSVFEEAIQKTLDGFRSKWRRIGEVEALNRLASIIKLILDYTNTDPSMKDNILLKVFHENQVMYMVEYLCKDSRVDKSVIEKEKIQK